MLFHKRILNFPLCLVPSDDYLNGSKHINFLFPHTFQTVWCNLILVVSSWTHPTPYPSSRYWKSNKKKVKMGPKFDPTAITIGKIILTKKSLVIYTPPPSETYQQSWSGKFCWLRNVSVLNTIESRVFKPHKTINESPLNLICFRIGRSHSNWWHVPYDTRKKLPPPLFLPWILYRDLYWKVYSILNSCEISGRLFRDFFIHFSV